ncbi:MAG: antitoxin VapB family protein [Nanoarchaeota archaeon]
MSKLINIADKTYEKLKQMKGKDESFTIIIENLVEKNANKNKKKFGEFYGKGGIDEKAIEDLKKGWKKWTEKSA